MDIIELVKDAYSKGILFNVSGDQIEILQYEDIEIDSDLITKFELYRKDLISFLRSNKDIYSVFPPYKSDEFLSTLSGGRALLSHSQESFYFMDKVGDTIAYNVPLKLRIEGPLNMYAIEAAWRYLLNRHDILRSIISQDLVGNYQNFLPVNEWKLDFSDHSNNIVVSSVETQVVEDFFYRKFNIDRELPLRVKIIKTSNECYLMLVAFHHIVIDGHSIDIIIRELALAYKYFSLGEIPSMPLVLQYKDFAAFERSQEKEYENGLKYWKRQLYNLKPTTIPTDYPRRIDGGTHGRTIDFTISATVVLQLSEIANKFGVSLSIVLISIFKILLYKYTNTHDVSLGTIVSRRENKYFNNVVGCFINSLVLRTEIDKNYSLGEYLQIVKEVMINGLRYQNIPFDKVTSSALQSRSYGNPLFNILLIYEDKNPLNQTGIENLIISKENVPSKTSRMDLTLTVSKILNSLQCQIEYSTDLFSGKTIELLSSHFHNLLDLVGRKPFLKIKEMSILSEIEHCNLIDKLSGFKDKNDYKRGNILELFNNSVRNFSSLNAVTFNNESLTYKELDDLSNKLGNYLISLGVVHGDRVALGLFPSLEMIISILGILKAGASYIPIDPSIPQKRIENILNESNCQMFIVDKELSKYFKTYSDLHLIFLENNVDFLKSSSAPLKWDCISGSSTAYIMFTSGTTGSPKGVVVSHRNIVGLFENVNKIFGFNSTDVWTLFHSYNFDISVWEIFGCFFNGGRLVVVPKDHCCDSISFRNLLIKEAVTVLNQTPTVFFAMQNIIFEEYGSLKIRYILLGGEPLHTRNFRGLNLTGTFVSVYNMYGITETSVYSTFYKLDLSKELDSRNIIGKPLPNTYIYILDEDHNIVPEGIPGEIYIGGSGVSKGYLNAEELNHSRFIQDKFFRQRGTLYKTGDLGRWTESGDIEFLGRIDTQVKINGFRIELSEIQIHIENMQRVHAARVVEVDKESGGRLIAFFVSESEIENDVFIKSLREYLPEYMIPRAFYKVNFIPVTSNGKTDLKKLIDLIPIPKVEKLLPNTKEENLLIVVLQGVLRDEDIGIDDNFFSIGGDSIKSIQIVAKLRIRGYEISVKDFFQYQILRAIAKRMRKVERVISQLEIMGSGSLGPIQKWFTLSESKNKNHFNQSVIMTFKEHVSSQLVENVFFELIKHHDLLRVNFLEKNGSLVPSIDHFDKRISCEVVDYRDIVFDSKSHKIKIDCCQESINIEQGPLIRLCLFQYEKESKLLVIVHHLIIDGVSWRILLEDMESLFSKRCCGNKNILPLKTDSFFSWTAQISEYVKSKRHYSTFNYWKDVCNKDADFLPKQTTFVKSKKYSSVSNSSIFLSKSDAELLLKDCHKAFATGMNDILLSALMLTYAKSYNSKSMKIDLEGHGRDIDWGGTLDISRTIGWFTVLFPVVLEYDNEDLGDLIQKIKEILGAIPDKGADYLIHKFYDNKIYSEKKAEIRFNYLGHFESREQGIISFDGSDYKGNDISKNRLLEYSWDIIGISTEQGFSLSISYSNLEFHENDIQEFLRNFKENLLSIIKFCTTKDCIMLSPKDITYNGLSIAQLNVLQKNREVVDILPLIPMQKNLYFRYLKDSKSTEYFQVLLLEFFDRLNVDAFEAAVNTVCTRHDSLRCVFQHSDSKINEPYQVIYKKLVVDFQSIDIFEKHGLLSKDLIPQALIDAEKLEVFDIEEKPPLRFRVYRLSHDCYFISIVYHHIILDGWSVNILLSELMQVYNGIIRGVSVNLVPTIGISTYTKWYEQCDKNRGLDFWKSYLSKFDKITSLPKKENIQRGSYKEKRQTVHIEKKELDLLNQFSADYGITINNILQTSWAILLAKFNNTRDVIFGSVVSGRTANISGIESMLGLFINTIPMRFIYSEEDSFKEFVIKSQQDFSKCESFSYVQMSEVNSEDFSNVLFDHIFVFENFSLDNSTNGYAPQLPNVEDNFLKIHSYEKTNFDLSLSVSLRDKIYINFDYNENVYSESVIRDVSNQYISLVAQTLKKPEARICDLEILSIKSKNEIINRGHGIKSPLLPTENILYLLSDIVNKHKENIAVFFEGKKVTYGELDERSNRIASLIRSKEKLNTGIIPIICDRGIEQIIGIISILKAGSAYAPIDPLYPKTRIDKILNSLTYEVGLVQGEYKNKLKRNDEFVLLDSNKADESDEKFKVDLDFNSDRLACILFTSGSTGEPKGVKINHKAIVNLIRSQSNYYSLNYSERILQFSNYTFDASVEQIFLSLLQGHQLFIINEKDIYDQSVFVELLHKYKITHLDATPSYLEGLNFRNLPFLKRIVSGGEQFKLELYSKWGKSFDIYNAYGPTEASVTSLVHKCCDEDIIRNYVPIGSPIENVEVYVINKDGQLCPENVEGEIVLGGIGISPGYINEDELTKEKFYIDSISYGPLYRTGDIGKWSNNGRIEYLGRGDQQIKLRGFRIEVQDIERNLKEFKGISKVAVFPYGKGKHQFLVACYVSNSDIQSSQLKLYLSEKVPSYMIPAQFINVPRIITNSNDKLDIEAMMSFVNSFEPENHIPKTDLEKDLQQIWSTVLDIPSKQISIYDNFFDLGGNSLSLMNLLNGIVNKLNIQISISDLFKFASIRLLSEHLENRNNNEERIINNQFDNSLDETVLLLSTKNTEL